MPATNSHRSPLTASEWELLVESQALIIKPWLRTAYLPTLGTTVFPMVSCGELRTIGRMKTANFSLEVGNASLSKGLDLNGIFGACFESQNDYGRPLKPLPTGRQYVWGLTKDFKWVLVEIKLISACLGEDYDWHRVGSARLCLSSLPEILTKTPALKMMARIHQAGEEMLRGMEMRMIEFKRDFNAASALHNQARQYPQSQPEVREVIAPIQKKTADVIAITRMIADGKARIITADQEIVTLTVTLVDQEDICHKCGMILLRPITSTCRYCGK